MIGLVCLCTDAHSSSVTGDDLRTWGRLVCGAAMLTTSLELYRRPRFDRRGFESSLPVDQTSLTSSCAQVQSKTEIPS